MYKNIKDKMTYEDCLKFKQEHPDISLTTLNKKYTIYSKAMRKFGLLDELFPDRRVTHERYSDEFLIAEARKYPNKKELREILSTKNRDSDLGNS